MKKAANKSTTKKPPVKAPTTASCPKCGKEYAAREIGLECGNKVAGGLCTGRVRG